MYEALKVLRYKTKFHKIYNELWNVSLSALSKELFSENLAYAPFFTPGGFLTPVFKKPLDRN
jgi:hypothetical protein